LTEQDKLIFRVCVESGLRISDVLELRAWYLDKIIYVREKKTGKRRIITISDSLLSDLRAIKQFAVQMNDKGLYAFASARNAQKHIHRSTYHRHLKKACEALGMNFSAHSTRKLFAQELMKSSGDIFQVQKALNHKFITDTCTYLDIDFRDLIRSATDREELHKN
jgi:integrase